MVVVGPVSYEVIVDDRWRNIEVLAIQSLQRHNVSLIEGVKPRASSSPACWAPVASDETHLAFNLTGSFSCCERPWMKTNFIVVEPPDVSFYALALRPS